jgi:hypothetical protein
MILIAKEKEEKAILINYRGSPGYFISRIMLLDYHTLQITNPSLVKEISQYKTWIDEKNLFIDELNIKFFKLRKRFSIAIGITIGSCMISIAILAGIITYLILRYTSKQIESEFY